MQFLLHSTLSSKELKALYMCALVDHFWISMYKYLQRSLCLVQFLFKTNKATNLPCGEVKQTGHAVQGATGHIFGP